MNRSTALLNAARAEALFTSPLSTSGHPSLAEVTDAIRRAVRAHGGTAAAPSRSPANTA